MRVLLASIAMTFVILGWTHRYYIVSGPDYVVVGPHMFDSYVRSRSCLHVVTKRYPKLRLTVHQCEV